VITNQCLQRYSLLSVMAFTATTLAQIPNGFVVTQFDSPFCVGESTNTVQPDLLVNDGSCTTISLLPRGFQTFRTTGFNVGCRLVFFDDAACTNVLTASTMVIESNPEEPSQCFSTDGFPPGMFGIPVSMTVSCDGIAEA
jgi:hypothetical protein